jgi:hypothetical protein
VKKCSKARSTTFGGLGPGADRQPSFLGHRVARTRQDAELLEH